MSPYLRTRGDEFVNDCVGGRDGEDVSVGSGQAEKGQPALLGQVVGYLRGRWGRGVRRARNTWGEDVAVGGGLKGQAALLGRVIDTWGEGEGFVGGVGEGSCVGGRRMPAARRAKGCPAKWRAPVPDSVFLAPSSPNPNPFLRTSRAPPLMRSPAAARQ